MGLITSEVFYGDPLDCPHVNGSWLDRIRLVDAPLGFNLIGKCWLWTGWNNAKKGKGGPYGKVWDEGRADYIHRVMWQRHHGVSLLGGETIDHLCRVRLCFSPHHLENVGGGENLQRAREYAAKFNTEMMSQSLIDEINQCGF